MVTIPLRMLAMACVIGVVMAAAPARASLIQDFTFNGTNVMGQGYVEFDGMGGIVRLDISGTAWSDIFDFVNVTNAQPTAFADLDSNDEIIDWLWGTVGNTTNNLHTLDIDTFSPSQLQFLCITALASCGGNSVDTEVVSLVFTPHDVDMNGIPAPAALTVFAVGLAGLSWMRRRAARAAAA